MSNQNEERYQIGEYHCLDRYTFAVLVTAAVVSLL